MSFTKRKTKRANASNVEENEYHSHMQVKM